MLIYSLFHISMQRLVASHAAGFVQPDQPDQPIQEERVLFSSPDYPASYPENLNYTWTFQPPIGHAIQLYFLHFDLDDQGCGDHVIIGTIT